MLHIKQVENKTKEEIMDQNKTKNDFLHKSIDDAISTIRAMDIKSNVMIAFIGVIIFSLIRMDSTEDISGLTVFSIIWAIGTAIVFMYGVILPRINPLSEIKHVNDVIENDIEKKLFFPNDFKDLKNYFDSIDRSTDDSLLKILSLERLKQQVFIDKKIAYFKIGLYWGFVPFLILILINLITKI